MVSCDRSMPGEGRVRHFQMHELLALLFLLPVDRVPVILVGLRYRLLALAPAVILGCLCLRFCLGLDRSFSPGLVLRFDRSCFFRRSLFLRRTLWGTFLAVNSHQFSRLLTQRCSTQIARLMKVGRVAKLAGIGVTPEFWHDEWHPPCG